MRQIGLLPVLCIAFLIAAFLISLAGCSEKDVPFSESAEERAQATPESTDNGLQDGFQEPERIYDFAINNMTISSIEWQVGERVSIYPLVRNLGNSVESLKVQIVANGKPIKTYSLDLKHGEVKRLTHDWYPEESGRYVIKTVLDPENKFNDIHPENNQVNLSITISD